MKEKGKRFRTVRTKILASVLVTVVIAMTVLASVIVLYVKDSMTSAMNNYMIDFADSYGRALTESIKLTGNEASALGYDTLNEELKNASIIGKDSSYTYVVSEDGTMLYHPTKEKIGKPVENEVVKGLVTDIKSGKVPENSVAEYEFNGDKKYASYYVDPEARFILIVSADKSDTLSDVTTLSMIIIIGAVVIMLILFVVGYMLIARIIKPVRDISYVVEKAGRLDFTDYSVLDKYAHIHDELGVMSRDILNLFNVLKETLSDIGNHSVVVNDSASILDESAKSCRKMVNDIGAASEEIAQGATSQASETEDATKNVIYIGQMIEEATEETEHLLQTARNMNEAAGIAMQSVQELSEINSEVKQTVGVVSDKTINLQREIENISTFTIMITEIAEQTNLLALNASIEAARAGDAGRGFAVVATEIQNLAEQSNSSAEKIRSIVDKLLTEAGESVDIMKRITEIMISQDKTVAKTNDMFDALNDGVRISVEGVESITEKTEGMNQARTSVGDIMQSLTAIAEENAASTEETSATVTESVGVVEDIVDKIDKLKQVSNDLQERVGQFRL